MGVKARVRQCNQPFVKAPLIRAALVAAHQQNRLPRRVEGKGDASYFARPAKAQLLHVGVLRALQRIHCRPPQARAEIPQQQRMGQQFILQGFGQGREFGGEIVVKEDGPTHVQIMYLKPYLFKWPDECSRPMNSCRRTTSADYWRCRIAGRGGRFDRRIDPLYPSGTGNDLGRNGFRPMT